MGGADPAIRRAPSAVRPPQGAGHFSAAIGAPPAPGAIDSTLTCRSVASLAAAATEATRISSPAHASNAGRICARLPSPRGMVTRVESALNCAVLAPGEPDLVLDGCAVGEWSAAAVSGLLSGAPHATSGFRRRLNGQRRPTRLDDGLRLSARSPGALSRPNHDPSALQPAWRVARGGESRKSSAERRRRPRAWPRRLCNYITPMTNTMANAATPSRREAPGPLLVRAAAAR